MGESGRLDNMNRNGEEQIDEGDEEYGNDIHFQNMNQSDNHIDE
jgi:hypothetical protein